MTDEGSSNKCNRCSPPIQTDTNTSIQLIRNVVTCICSSYLIRICLYSNEQVSRCMYNKHKQKGLRKPFPLISTISNRKLKWA